MSPPDVRPESSRDIEPLLHSLALSNGPVAGPTGHLPLAHPPRRWVKARVKILFLTANALDGRPLGLGKEHRVLDECLRAAKYRSDFELVTRGAARFGDLRQALLEYRPDIVHFAGHGGAGAGLLMLDENDEPIAVSAKALASLFGTLRGATSLVVLNACFSAEQAEAIRNCVGLAVGMGEAIDDDAAVAFANALYQALFSGSSVRDAFDVGVAQLTARPVPQDHVPRLLAREGLDPATVAFAPARGVRPQLLAAAAVALGVVGAFGALRWVHELSTPSLPLVPSAPVLPPPAPPPPKAPPPPWPGMVRIAGGKVRVGQFDLAKRPAACATLAAAEDCTEATHPERARELEVATFDLDAAEVTNEDFALWLDQNADRWGLEPARYGVVSSRANADLRLAWVCEVARSCKTRNACAPCRRGGLVIDKGGRVRARAGFEQRPAVYVSWYGANDYCLTRGKRLPLDEEWEHAVKGHDGRPFAWGAELPTADSVAFGRRNSLKAGARSVQSSNRDRTPEGVFDLSGNVAEWVDGKGGTKPIARGGSWHSEGPCHLLGSGCSFHEPQDVGLSDVGFRCARSVTLP
ncbi:MAG TPA: SUMF1/EgtB/PvdO family nonheme iron enzyme [Polyangiaceae bacterium]|nr:SUMF1/EgtB/PvdO family nonheme iron enzyme [Polyangiaceae bacterium]